METPLNLEIVSPEKVIFSGDIELVEMPGKRGRFTILKDHAPIISSLTEGSIRVRPVGQEEINVPCKAGYVECSANKVSILLNA
ncbi:MAG: ATP synthase F1 subunit epsilon [Bacteroidales bacterium]|nr:ATP synthase F1 subunit epsilon [Bacteroidales bacterium]